MSKFKHELSTREDEEISPQTLADEKLVMIPVMPAHFHAQQTAMLSNPKPLNYVDLPSEIQNHMFSFFSHDHLYAVSRVNKSSSFIVEEYYRKKLKEDYQMELIDGQNSRLQYLQKEQEVREEYKTLLVYTAYRRVSAPGLNTVFVDCLVHQDSFKPFESAVRNYYRESEYHILTFESLEKQFSVYYAKMISKSGNSENIHSFLVDLCITNAHVTLHKILKNNPNLKVDFPCLMRIAIGCLHIPVVDVLLQFGANIHGYTVHSDYSDYGCQIHVSFLGFALMLPQENSGLIARTTPGILHWGCQKLIHLTDFLVSKGANPLQKCLITNSKAKILEMATEKKEGPDCIMMAKDLLSNCETRHAQPEYFILLEKIASKNIESEEDSFNKGLSP